LTIVRWLLLGALLGATSCANDTAAQPSDTGVSMDAGGTGAGSDHPADGDPNDATPGLLRDAAPADAGITQTEPPLTIPMCDGLSDPSCCPSALGFEDGSTEHFLPPVCCKRALSNPRVVMSPTACGRGALQLDAAFRTTSAASLCGKMGEDEACAFQTGEISRAVLTSLDVTGLTMSAAVYLDGPPLPAGPVDAQLFVLGQGGLIEGTPAPLSSPGVWSAVELPIGNDGTAPGAGIRLIGLRIAFHGQAWAGRAYVDEFSWN
jgi:hypothetical protein